MPNSEGEGSVEEFRTPSSAEQAVIRVLLEAKFPGDSALREQMSKALVRTIDDDGSLEISVDDGPWAEVAHRIPVEAVAPDSDGVPIHVLLHVVGGKLQELEYFREDSRPVQHPPAADDLRVSVL